MSATRFGDYLSQLLSERGCSGSRLASMVGVDPALVYRWLRNEAVPKLDTAYSNEIARSLHLSQAELSRLKEAQIFSLSKPLEKRLKARSGGAAVERLLRHAGSHTPSNGASALTLPVLADPASRRNGVIWGRPAILEATIALLESLPILSRHQNETLLLSFQGEEDAFSDFPALKARYEHALQGVLQRGWRVCHLWRLSSDSLRAILIVQDMLKLLGTGRYLPYYMDQYGTLAPPYDLLVAPQAAMLFFATQTPLRTDAALLTHDLGQIELFRTHFYQLSAQGHPLVRSAISADRDTIWQAFTEAESHPGGRVAVKDGLSFLTEPPAWYHEGSRLLQATGLSKPVLTSIIASQRQRLAAFQTNSSTSFYRDICPRGAVERLVRDGETNRNDRLFGLCLSKEERREQLEYTLFLLKTYEQYQLALVDEQEKHAIPTEMFWEVAGKRTVLMNAWSTDMNGKDVIVDVIINEPTIAHAFHDYFLDLWERIAPEHKDKSAVISWLEDQLALLK